jgi:hypothetical protein
MRLDKQQVAFRGIGKNTVSFEATERFFSHRDYIYFLEEKKDLYVNLRGTIYVKFPTSFALRTVVTGPEDDKKKETKVDKTNGDTLQEKMYCVMFDTRRYDCFRKIKVEDKADMELIQSMTHVKMMLPQDAWLPLLENNFETLQWIQVSDHDMITRLLQPGYAFENKNPGDDEKDCNFFTLPDFMLRKRKDEEAYLESVDELFLYETVETTDSCFRCIDDLVESKTWWSMRGESGNLVGYYGDDKTKKYSCTEMYEDVTIAKFMGDIDAILTPSASESMEH